MTTTVHYEGYPDRLACPLCACDVGSFNTNQVAYAVGTHEPGGYGWYLRDLDVDEPARSFHADCVCRCHDTARRFLRQAYDPA